MAPMEKSIGVKVVLISNGPSEALKELDKGAVDAASGGLTFPDWMAMMDKEGYQIPDKSAYKHRVIGKDIVKVLTNKDVAVKQLSKDQLKAIFTGAVKNWKEVGGPDKPVVVFLGSKIPGTQSVFQKQAMDGGDYTKDAKEGTTAEDLKTKVAATAGAVCLGPASIADGSVHTPEIPEVGRPITLITKGEPAPGIVKMLEFIRGEGKKYIDG
jgi:phosphate transport system substrate-binding protein